MRDETGEMRDETGEMRDETGDMRQETGDRRQETRFGSSSQTGRERRSREMVNDAFDQASKQAEREKEHMIKTAEQERCWSPQSYKG